MTMTLMMPSLWRASTVQNTGPQLVPLAGANATWTLDGSVILSRNVLGSKCRRRTGLQPGDGGRLFSQENRMPNGAPSLPAQRSGYWRNVWVVEIRRGDRGRDQGSLRAAVECCMFLLGATGLVLQLRFNWCMRLPSSWYPGSRFVIPKRPMR
ncbi:hypothetical protein BJ912DRAFT_111785 [Pholiota molesta]|nr:hypothetical protein BJ912DRAFT_111785 [Pholiota molesta]